MGCAFQGIAEYPYQEDYARLRDSLYSTPQFHFLNHFYFQIWPAANKLIEQSNRFDEIRSVHSRVLSLLEEIELMFPLKPLSLILSTFTDQLYPFLKQAEQNLTYSCKTASQFVARHSDFAKEIGTFYHLKKCVQDKKCSLLDGGNRYQSGKLLLLYCHEKLSQKCEGIKPVSMNFTSMNQFFMLLDCALFTDQSLDQIDEILHKKHKLKNKSVRERLIGCTSIHVTCDILKASVQELLQIGSALQEKYDQAQMAEVPYPIDFPQFDLPPKGWLNIKIVQQKGKISIKESLPDAWVQEHRGDPPPSPRKIDKDQLQFKMDTTQ